MTWELDTWEALKSPQDLTCLPLSSQSIWWQFHKSTNPRNAALCHEPVPDATIRISYKSKSQIFAVNQVCCCFIRNRVHLFALFLHLLIHESELIIVCTHLYVLNRKVIINFKKYAILVLVSPLCFIIIKSRKIPSWHWK